MKPQSAPRFHCVCCALPPRVLRHVASKAQGEHSQKLAEHAQACADLRAMRRATADSAPHSAAAAGAQRAIYDAGGKKKLPGRLVLSGAGGESDDPVANDAWRNVGITLDFYAKVFKRNSLDDKGMRVDSSVHYGDRFPNAFWSGKEMLFGDGDGVHVMGFARSLDIVAHELAHAVTQHTIKGGLGESHHGNKVELVGQAGALNESFSDVFASMVKQWHGHQNVHEADWLVGEGILAPHLGRAVRSLEHPGDTRLTYPDDDQPGDMRGFVPGGDAHTNSGIPNRAFHLAAIRIGGNSWQGAGPIWYQALRKLASTASFAEAAAATEHAASEMHGAGSPQHKAVNAAWREVRVIP